MTDNGLVVKNKATQLLGGEQVKGKGIRKRKVF